MVSKTTLQKKKTHKKTRNFLVLPEAIFELVLKLNGF